MLDDLGGPHLIIWVFKSQDSFPGVVRERYYKGRVREMRLLLKVVKSCHEERNF